MSHPSLSPRLTWAVAAGVLSGVLATGSLVLVAQLIDTPSGFLGMLLEMITPLSVSAGLSFGVVSAIYGWRYLCIGWPAALVWVLASMASITAAFYATFLVYDINDATNYVATYLMISTVGATVYLLPVLWSGRFENGMAMFVKGLSFPTLWALLVAVAMADMNNTQPLAPAWSFLTFTGWQTIMLLVLSGARKSGLSVPTSRSGNSAHRSAPIDGR